MSRAKPEVIDLAAEADDDQYCLVLSPEEGGLSAAEADTRRCRRRRLKSASLSLPKSEQTEGTDVEVPQVSDGMSCVVDQINCVQTTAVVLVEV